MGDDEAKPHAFEGSVATSRVPLFDRGRPSLPVPTPWNFKQPLAILDAIFWGAEGEGGDNRVVRMPGLRVLVTRDPGLIKAVLLATGDKEHQFDRDTWPARGIAKATGPDTILYANGAAWRNQKKLAAPSFARGTLFQPENFAHFEATFRKTIAARLELLADMQQPSDVDMAHEISIVMLEMLVNNFFGGNVSYEALRDRYAPAISGLIAHMIRDTVRPGFTDPARWRKSKQVAAWSEAFEELTDIAMAGRSDRIAAWAQFESDAPDEALRSNIRVFLAGALEATTSLASWAVSHLAHRPEVQDQIYDEIRDMDVYDPDNLDHAVTLNRAIEETLRLTPSLYFLPRRATKATWVKLGDGRRVWIPARTRVYLDVWHANRNEAYWGVERTGFPAKDFEPARWAHLAEQGVAPNDMLHFGFGHGPRVCPGKFLGLLEVGLVVGAIVKVFRFEATGTAAPVAGVSTKPSDCTVRLRLRTDGNPA